MKKLLFAFLLGCVPFAGYAQEPTMAALFKEMPDSLMPYLTKNNRLDMLDFMEAGMKAEVTNRLEGRSVMTFLSADSLFLQLSDVLTVGMKLQQVDEPIDSSRVLIRVLRTYVVNEKQAECIEDVYTSAWRCLQSKMERSSLLKRDETLFEQQIHR